MIPGDLCAEAPATVRRVLIAGTKGTSPGGTAEVVLRHRPDWCCEAVSSSAELLTAWNLSASASGGTTTVLLLAQDQPDVTEMAAEQDLRTTLWEHHIPHQVIYGNTKSFTTQACQVLGLMPMPARRTMVPWNCEKCSDPECEHRLFQSLLAQRQDP
jgi:hypothetical protein